MMTTVTSSVMYINAEMYKAIPLVAAHAIPIPVNARMQEIHINVSSFICC